MTSEEPLLKPRVAEPVFRGGSGVNGFARRFAELRSFAAKKFEALKTTLNESSRARGIGDGEKAENLADDLDVAGVVDIKPT
jgi:hypothetical protein